jgi:hypothetical protein
MPAPDTRLQRTPPIVAATQTRRPARRPLAGRAGSAAAKRSPNYSLNNETMSNQYTMLKYQL